MKLFVFNSDPSGKHQAVGRRARDESVYVPMHLSEFSIENVLLLKQCTMFFLFIALKVFFFVSC